MPTDPIRQVTLEPCPFCGASPITDPNARGYHTSAAWECGTTRVWVNKDRLHQSGRCKDDEGRPEGHPTSNGGTQTPAEVSVNDGPVQQSPLQVDPQGGKLIELAEELAQMRREVPMILAWLQNKMMDDTDHSYVVARIMFGIEGGEYRV